MLFGDASVRYVPLKSFLKQPWMFIPPGDVSTANNDYMLSWDPDGGVWNDLDKQ